MSVGLSLLLGPELEEVEVVRVGVRWLVGASAVTRSIALGN